MGRIFKVETTKEYYEQKIVLCSRDISECELDLAQNERCLDKCDNAGTEHWEICVAIDEEKLRKSREYLTFLRMRLKEANNGHN